LLDPLNFIWGFQKSRKRDGDKYKNKLYLYFKVCFNTSKNLWQFCKNNYTFSKSGGGGRYLDGKKVLKKSVRKSSKKVLRKSVRKSSKKVLRKF